MNNNSTKLNIIYEETPRVGGRLQVGIISVETEIPMETHKEVTQFIRVESGYGTLEMNGRAWNLGPGEAAIIRSGVAHRIVNTSGVDNPLKLYTIYAKDSSAIKWNH